LKPRLPETEDPLLRRVRRSAAKARTLARSDDRRRALVMMAEIREQIRQLQQRLNRVEDEIRASTRRITAVNAYNRCAALGQRSKIARSPEAKS
jgi:hypothetical protein